MSIGMVNPPISMRFPNPTRLLFAVVDGMGGHRGGQEASRHAAQHLLDHCDEDVPSLLDGANSHLYEEMNRVPSLLGMGATVAGVAVAGSSANIFNVGDARVYQMAEGYLMLASVDDRSAPDSNVVTQSLGGAERPTSIVPHQQALDLAPGHTLLICSDGLSEVVPFDSIQTVLAGHRGVTGPSLLLEMALDAGAPDNVSIVTVEFDHE